MNGSATRDWHRLTAARGRGARPRTATARLGGSRPDLRQRIRAAGLPITGNHVRPRGLDLPPRLHWRLRQPPRPVYRAHRHRRGCDGRRHPVIPRQGRPAHPDADQLDDVGVTDDRAPEEPSASDPGGDAAADPEPDLASDSETDGTNPYMAAIQAALQMGVADLEDIPRAHRERGRRGIPRQVGRCASQNQRGRPGHPRAGFR
jgi:hypothetical protein